jgi:hypothetical protein
MCLTNRTLAPEMSGIASGATFFNLKVTIS